MERTITLNHELYEKAFQFIPLGLMMLNSDYHIVAWNDWMESKTKIKEKDAVGKKINALFPEVNYDRFHWALEQVFDFGAPQVLSQILNHYLIPIMLEKDMYMHVDAMQQHVEILPIKNGVNWLALVVIHDVTHNVHQRNVLMQMAHKLEEESYHDALTSAYNRRFLWGYLDKLIAWSKRESSEIACVMLDLDYFKNVNDEFGHDRGDQVILFFVELINKIIRPSDVFVRYGGEEFILLISNLNLDSAVELANRIRLQCEEKSLSLNLGRSITCSIGVSLWLPREPYLEAKTLVDLADKALYQAKQSGRNCIRVAL